MSELLATVSGAEVKVWRPDAQVRARCTSRLQGNARPSARSMAFRRRHLRARHRDPVADLPSPTSTPQHADNIAAAALRCDVHCIEWSPTNGALACGGADGRAHLLKPSGELLGRIPDASPEASADLYARDTETGTTSLSSVAPPIRALAFSKGSRYLASAGAATEVTIWDLKRKSKLKSLVGHADAVAAVAYSPGDQHVASAGREGRIILHSPVSGLVVGEMQQAPGASTSSGLSGFSGIAALHYSPHRRQMLASASADGAVRVWDTGVRRLASTLSTLLTDDVPSAVNDARFSPAAPNVLAAACADGRVVLMDVGAGSTGSNRHRTGSVAVGAGATSVAWRGDGNVLAVGASDGRVVWLDSRMLGDASGRSGAGGASVLYTTAAHVGTGGVTSVRWQRAADGSAAASTAAEANTPTLMKATRHGDESRLDESRAREPRVGDAHARSPPGQPLFAVDANASDPRSEKLSTDAAPDSALDAKERAARRAAELEEEARKRVERLLSARGAGTPEAAAAAARPTRGGAPTPAPKTLALSPRLGAGTGAAGAGAHLDVPGTLALAEAIAETRRVTTSAVRDVHVEILRQMHEMREAQTEMFREVREAQKELAAEVAALRMAQREFVRR